MSNRQYTVLIKRRNGTVTNWETLDRQLYCDRVTILFGNDDKEIIEDLSVFMDNEEKPENDVMEIVIINNRVTHE